MEYNGGVIGVVLHDTRFPGVLEITKLNTSRKLRLSISVGARLSIARINIVTHSYIHMTTNVSSTRARAQDISGSSS